MNARPIDRDACPRSSRIRASIGWGLAMDLFDLYGLKRRATFYDDVKHLLGADKAPKPRNLSATFKQRLRALAKSAAGSSAIEATWPRHTADSSYS